MLRNAAGNFYINDKSTGSVVGQQPFGGARTSGEWGPLSRGGRVPGGRPSVLHLKGFIRGTAVAPFTENRGPGPVLTQSCQQPPKPRCCHSSSHFMEEQTEAQGSEVTCLRAHGSRVVAPGFGSQCPHLLLSYSRLPKSIPFLFTNRETEGRRGAVTCQSSQGPETRSPDSQSSALHGAPLPPRHLLQVRCRDLGSTGVLPARQLLPCPTSG